MRVRFVTPRSADDILIHEIKLNTLVMAVYSFITHAREVKEEEANGRKGRALKRAIQRRDDAKEHMASLVKDLVIEIPDAPKKKQPVRRTYIGKLSNMSKKDRAKFQRKHK